MTSPPGLPSAALAELFRVPAGLLNDDRLGRALDAISPHAEDLRAALLLPPSSAAGRRRPPAPRPYGGALFRRLRPLCAREKGLGGG